MYTQIFILTAGQALNEQIRLERIFISKRKFRKKDVVFSPEFICQMSDINLFFARFGLSDSFNFVFVKEFTDHFSRNA